MQKLCVGLLFTVLLTSHERICRLITLKFNRDAASFSTVLHVTKKILELRSLGMHPLQTNSAGAHASNMCSRKEFMRIHVTAVFAVACACMCVCVCVSQRQKQRQCQSRRRLRQVSSTQLTALYATHVAPTAIMSRTGASPVAHPGIKDGTG